MEWGNIIYTMTVCVDNLVNKLLGMTSISNALAYLGDIGNVGHGPLWLWDNNVWSTVTTQIYIE